MAKNTEKSISPWVTMLSELNLDVERLKFKDASELKAAYEAADNGIKHAVESSLSKQAELIRALAKMRSILSQRGGSKLRKEAGVMNWTQYFAWFKETYELNMCLRTATKKIDIVSGKKLCPSCGKEKGHTPSCPYYEKRHPALTAKECSLIAALTAGNDLVRALECGGNIVEAAGEYSKLAPSPERLEQWTDRQIVPYVPKIEDVIAIDGEEYSIAEIRASKHMDGLVVSLVVLSLNGSNVAVRDPEPIEPNGSEASNLEADQSSGVCIPVPPPTHECSPRRT
ncbi:MAG: hypothetical protein ACM3JB_27025 [Acidobacteriaceae bacterium]